MKMHSTKTEWGRGISDLRAASGGDVVPRKPNRWVGSKCVVFAPATVVSTTWAVGPLMRDEYPCDSNGVRISGPPVRRDIDGYWSVQEVPGSKTPSLDVVWSSQGSVSMAAREMKSRRGDH